MGAFDSSTGSPATTQAELIEKMLASFDWQDFEVEKALPVDLKTAITDALAWIKNPKGDAPKDALDRVAAFLGKVAGGKYPYPSPQGKSKKDEEAAAAAKAAGKGPETCPECGAFLKDGKCPKCGYEGKACNPPDKGKTKKSDEDTTITVAQDGTVTVSSPASKGSKQFTGDRKSGLADAVKSLIGMLADVDPNAAKSIIEELTKSILPADVKWTAGTVAADASVAKMLSDGVAAAIAPVAKQLGELATKVEEISKARTAPQSADDGTPPKPVKKSDGSFWKGVPLT